MRVPFLDLKAINDRHKADIIHVLEKVLDSGFYIGSSHVSEFEHNFASFCQSKYCVGVGNGLDALTLILKAFGVGIGDEVIVPANTFIATILAISATGATPVLVEPEEATYAIDPWEVKKAITSKTKAIMVVHLYGRPADTERIREVLDGKEIRIIEDAAQAHGATIKGKRVGSLGDAAAFSFYPGKNLGALGDGGAVVTNNEEIYRKVKYLANYGSDRKYHHILKGINSRLDAIQAQILNAKLEKLDSDNDQRKKAAAFYCERIKNSNISLPNMTLFKDSVWHIFPVRVQNREHFQAYMTEQNVETNIHYPTAPMDQLAYPELRHLNLPITRKIHQQVISLPMSPILSQEQLEYVVQTVNNYKINEGL